MRPARSSNSRVVPIEQLAQVRLLYSYRRCLPCEQLGAAKRSIGLELVEGTVLGTDRSMVLSKRVFTSVHSLGTTFPFVTCPTGKYWTRVASGYLQMPLQSKVDVAQSR